MKLMFRPEFNPWPLSSFMGVLDLKTGVTIALLFALLNKVAGVYGLIAVLTGAGGSFPQLSLYIYSTIALVALGWGLNAVKSEDAQHTLYFAHLFFADHIFSTSWTVYFAVTWWLHTAHDGLPSANSSAQKDMIERHMGGVPSMTSAERTTAALDIWNREKNRAAAVIVLSWLCKFYFALLLYSYATHLRKGSYRSLPLSRTTTSTAVPNTYNASQDEDLDEQIEDFYRVPISAAGTHTVASYTNAVVPKNTQRGDDVLFDGQAADDPDNDERRRTRSPRMV